MAPLVRTFAVLVPLLAFAGPAAAGTTVSHGVAMHGEPKYLADFHAFDYVNSDAPQGGTIRHAVVGTFDSLNPWIVKGRPAVGLSPQVVETLMARAWDEPFSLYGLIAETVEMPEDRAWVAFTVRSQARWHDGTAITADDVLFSFETLRGTGRPNYRAYYGRVAVAEKTGERSVRFAFQPDADGRYDRELPLIMGLMPILSKAYWSGREFGRTTLEPPMGSGPYRVAAVDPGRSVTYERVPDYWGRGLPVTRGQHNVDVIRYDWYRDDGVALEAFKGGLVDFRRETDPARWATAYDLPAVRDGRIKLEVLPHGRPEPMRAFMLNTRRFPFADRRVREALGLAFDFEWMNRTLFHGAYRRIDSFYPNSELAARGPPSAGELALLAPFRAELPAAAFSQAFAPPRTDGSGPAGLRPNLRRAAEGLAEAGWVVRDGRLVQGATGRPLAFEILLVSPPDERVALEWARALARIGVTAKVRTVDSAQYQKRLDTFDFDVTLNRWVSTLSPGNEQLFYYGAQAAGQEGSRNYPGIRSAAVDTLAAGLANAASRADLVVRLRALDRALLWGHYTVPLYYLPGDRVAYAGRLHHPAVAPVYGLIIETWWEE